MDKLHFRKLAYSILYYLPWKIVSYSSADPETFTYMETDRPPPCPIEPAIWLQPRACSQTSDFISILKLFSRLSPDLEFVC